MARSSEHPLRVTDQYSERLPILILHSALSFLMPRIFLESEATAFRNVEMWARLIHELLKLLKSLAHK